ncbi:hypothetical protein RIF29_43326 [Crotalaria pallida]|uniref:H(+)-transporting two-sector ATPase n=1 Tax=Crotalaria pallida TaxID=3830 RepID=A0AAN9HR33_CROPI
MQRSTGTPKACSCKLGSQIGTTGSNIRDSKSGFQAGSEVSALLGRMPSAVGYQPTLSTEIGSLQERITSGSITSIQAVYVPATTFAHLDATTVLSRGLAAKVGWEPLIEKEEAGVTPQPMNSFGQRFLILSLNSSSSSLMPFKRCTPAGYGLINKTKPIVRLKLLS